jgi:hypothetical protein
VPEDPAAAMQQALLDKEKELRDLLGVQRSLQRALGGVDTVAMMASQVCLALCNFPGVRHTALLHMKERGDLQLVAQEARNHLDLGRLLQRRDRLLQSPLRDVFPPLMAVARGELMLLDAPEKSGDPELAMALHDRSVRMVLALPLRAEPGGPEIGAICLMFDRHIMFSREQFACFASLAQFVSFGLGMSELRHRNDVLSGQLSQISTVDTVTGAANRRAGEDTLDNEIRRARRYGLPLAVLSFDVTSFRSSSDLYGSGSGRCSLAPYRRNGDGPPAHFGRAGAHARRRIPDRRDAYRRGRCGATGREAACRPGRGRPAGAGARCRRQRQHERGAGGAGGGQRRRAGPPRRRAAPRQARRPQRHRTGCLTPHHLRFA